ncbi:MAG: lysyl oxidase family protein, partial [Actinomycetota bacterium]|nr:lysyl oxidase family protein [Actinomycetota bacterium]
MAALASLVLVVGGPAPAAGQSARVLLPDLDQALPRKVRVVADESRLLLTFSSRVANRGRGPLIVTGRRPSSGAPMSVRQTIGLANGASRSPRVRAELRYVTDRTHSHWHLLAFMRYAVRSTTGEPLGLSDRKTGFCFGDGYRVSPRKPLLGEPRRRVFRGCRRNQPRTLRVRMGLSVGFGDSYSPLREGQYVDISTLPTGRYLLVHTANPDRALAESDCANNSASVLFALARDADTARIRVLARCADTP